MMQYLTSIGLLGLILNAIPACEQQVKPETHMYIDTLELSTEEHQKVKADNQFTLDLFAQTLKQAEADENLLISPLSVSMSLGMAANGAVGTTQEALYKTLRFEGFKPGFINPYYQKLMQALPHLDSAVQINIANSIWYKDSFKVDPDFLKTNAEYYQATATGLDFTDSKSIDKINTWVSENTKGKIPSIVETLPADLRMLLVNALYFKGAWETPFKQEQTRLDQFTSPSGEVETPFMHRQGSIPVSIGSSYRAVELAYGKEKMYSMLAVLPEAGVNPASLLQEFQENPDTWADFSPRMVSLDMPKFSYSYERTLNQDLGHLGMDLPMSPQADFTGMSPQGGLRISEVKHKTFIEVNEEGTEAAAATSTGISVTSMPMYLEMHFNRPFIFFIRENTSGLILFAGSVQNPAQ